MRILDILFKHFGCHQYADHRTMLQYQLWAISSQAKKLDRKKRQAMQLDVYKHWPAREVELIKWGAHL